MEEQYTYDLKIYDNKQEMETIRGLHEVHADDFKRVFDRLGIKTKINEYKWKNGRWNLQT